MVRERLIRFHDTYCNSANADFDAQVLFDIKVDEFDIIKGLNDLAKTYDEWEGAENTPFRDYLLERYEDVEGVRGVKILPMPWIYAIVDF